MIFEPVATILTDLDCFHSYTSAGNISIAARVANGEIPKFSIVGTTSTVAVARTFSNYHTTT
jgi:hypothetical protein